MSFNNKITNDLNEKSEENNSNKSSHDENDNDDKLVSKGIYIFKNLLKIFIKK